jgi:hypothetical protein
VLSSTNKLPTHWPKSIVELKRGWSARWDSHGGSQIIRIIRLVFLLMILNRKRRNEMMKGIKYSVSMMIVVALAFVLVGCAKPPDTEKSAAKAAMDAAVTAGADKYAAGDFESAKGRWDTAESQMANKDYKEAKQSYM